MVRDRGTRDFDTVGVRIHSLPDLGDHAVNRYLTAGDHLVRGAARAVSGGGQDLLQPFAHVTDAPAGTGPEDTMACDLPRHSLAQRHRVARR